MNIGNTVRYEGECVGGPWAGKRLDHYSDHFSVPAKYDDAWLDFSGHYVYSGERRKWLWEESK